MRTHSVRAPRTINGQVEFRRQSQKGSAEAVSDDSEGIGPTNAAPFF